MQQFPQHAYLGIVHKGMSGMTGPAKPAVSMDEAIAHARQLKDSFRERQKVMAYAHALDSWANTGAAERFDECLQAGRSDKDECELTWEAEVKGIQWGM